MWGSICADYWDLRDADVVCRQLGYEGALSASAFWYPTSGQNTGQIRLNGVNCEGNETSISECKHLGWGALDCRYYTDATVICRPTGKAMKHTSKKIKKISSFLFFVCSFESMVIKRITLYSPEANLRNGCYHESVYFFLIKF